MKNKFDYFFREKPAVKAELAKLNIKFIEVDVGDGDRHWPGLELPSGAILAIAQDDEGNGPGAIHCFDPEPK